MDSLTNVFRSAANAVSTRYQDVKETLRRDPLKFPVNAVKGVAMLPVKAAMLPIKAVWNPLYKHALNPQISIEGGWNHAHKRPALSDSKKHELMEASALETPRSTSRSMLGILAPYWNPKKSGPKEVATASVLLATSLYLTWYAVQVTVDFSQWAGQMTDTLVNMGNTQTDIRPDAIEATLKAFPGVGELLEQYPTLKDITLKYPDAMGIFNGVEMGQINALNLNDILQEYPDINALLENSQMAKDFITQPIRAVWANPEYRAFLSLPENQEFFQLLQTNPPPTAVLNNIPDIVQQISGDSNLQQQLLQFSERYGEMEKNWEEILTTFPSLEEIFSNFPGLEAQIKADPNILNEITEFKNELGQVLQNNDKMQQDYRTVGTLFGSEFFNSWEKAFVGVKNNFAELGAKGTLESAWNTAQNIGARLSPFHEVDSWNGSSGAKTGLGHALYPFKQAWDKNDFATIALKYTGMALIAFKSKQYMAMKWRSWSTGYYSNKWMNNNAYQRIKNQFSNVDNPDQRLQDDPAIFTAAAISISTGLLSSGMTLAAYSKELWDMGSMNLMVYGGPDVEIPGAMMMFSLGWAGLITGTTMALGWKLPFITRAQQKLEGNFRSSMKLAHEFADNIALEKGEKLQLDTIKKNFKPLMENSVRDLTINTRMIVADSAFGNFAYTVPKLIANGMIGAGQMTVGGMNTLGSYFGRITGSLSFVANRWNQLTQVKATADRIYMMDRALEAAHYLEAEKDYYSERATNEYLASTDNKPSAPEVM